MTSIPSHKGRKQVSATNLSLICNALTQGDNINEPNEAPKQPFIEDKVKELFEMVEQCVLKKSTKLDISKTAFDGNLVLEINNEHAFLQLDFDAEQLMLSQTDEVETLIQLSYTSQDIRPIRGRIISGRRFQGVVDRFYLVEGKWYYLNPCQFANILKASELLLTEDFITNRILHDIFGI